MTRNKLVAVVVLLAACTDVTAPNTQDGTWSLESIRGDTVPIAESFWLNGQITQVTLYGAQLTVRGRTAIYSDAVLQWLNDKLVNRSTHYVFDVAGRDSMTLTFIDGDTLRFMQFVRMPNGTLDRADSTWTPRGEVWRQVKP